MQWDDWENKVPDCEGEFYMRDSSGGPTLYIFEYIDGVLVNGPKSRRVRWNSDEEEVHLPDAEFKRSTLQVSK
jgi:hypothetical protein